MHLNPGNKQLQSLCIKTTCSTGYEVQISYTLNSCRTPSELLHAHGTLQSLGAIHEILELSSQIDQDKVKEILQCNIKPAV